MVIFSKNYTNQYSHGYDIEKRYFLTKGSKQILTEYNQPSNHRIILEATSVKANYHKHIQATDEITKNSQNILCQNKPQIRLDQYQVDCQHHGTRDKERRRLKNNYLRENNLPLTVTGID